MSKAKTYTIQITDEQIKLIRSLSLRTERLYTHRGVAELVQDGEVKRVSYWECYFCGKASYESAAAIPHERKCIIPLMEKEYAGLNTQFLAVEE